MDYKRIDQTDIDFLNSIVPKERILSGPDIRDDYAHDEMGGISKYPEILVKIKSAQEICAIMKYATQKHIPVVVRGSGTGLVGASVAVHGGIMLEMLEMNQILELDEDNFTITVEPGVLLMEIADYCTQNGFLYPPDPGEKTATIGGNISTNAGGMRAVKYGVTRDYVRGLEVVLANGEIITLGGKFVKNSTGYSLLNLIVGSEGTLGIITKAILKIIPAPSVAVSLLVPFDNFNHAFEVVPKLLNMQNTPTAIEFMERAVIVAAEEYLGKKFPDSKSNNYLLLTFDGSDLAGVEKDYELAAHICLENGAPDVYIVDNQERKDAVWVARGAFLEAIKASTDEMDECDVVVPRNRLAEFISFTYNLSKELNIRIPSFGHAGDGNLHIYICRDGMEQQKWEEVLKKAFHAMYAKAAEIRGAVSGEHGIGFAKKEYMREQLGETHVALMRGIKKVFDPNNILNPGKIV